MRIYGLLEDLMGCGYHRIKAPLEVIPPDVATVHVSHQPPRDLSEWDVLQMQKFTMPELMVMLREIKKRGRPKMVMDMDDDLFNVPEHNVAHPFFHDSEINSNLRESLRLADGITVTNGHLARVCRKINPSAPIRIFPNQVSERHLKPLKWQRFNLGWAGGNSHLKDLLSVSNDVRRFMEPRPKLRLTIMGQDYRELFPGVRSRFVPWNRYDDYMRTLREKFSVGLAPVDRDEFNLGKSDIKLVEYAASGIVPVYSYLPPYNGSGIGIPVFSEGSFYNVLLALNEDEERLNLEISRAFQAVRRRTHEATWPERVEFYQHLLDQ